MEISVLEGTGHSSPGLDMVKAHKLNGDEKGAEISLETLKATTGVEYFTFNATDYEADLNKMKAERNYSFTDVVTISPATLPQYDEKIKIFFTEHLHKDEEVRMCLEGGGYFDVRDNSDGWVRIHCTPGDLVVLPAGIYHRFRNDEGNYSKFMRLFQGDPVWTPFNRAPEVDEFKERRDYINSLASESTGMKRLGENVEGETAAKRAKVELAAQ